MKKVIYFGGIIGCVLLTTSCNKSRTCECKVVHTITTKTSAGADTTYNTSPVTVENQLILPKNMDKIIVMK